MMGFIEPEQAEQAPAAISMEQEQAVVAECEAAPREEEVIPEGTAEAETGGIVLEEELERQGPAPLGGRLREDHAGPPADLLLLLLLLRRVLDHHVLWCYDIFVCYRSVASVLNR